MTLSNRIEQLEKELEELKKLEKERLVQYRPKIGDEYWFINSDGYVTCLEWEYDFFGQRIYEIGNTYRTKEEAEFVVEKIRTEVELRRFSKPFESEKNNYHISLDTEENTLNVSNMRIFQSQGAIYFGSEEKAKEAIRAVGERRIRKYIFGSVYDD